MSDSSIWTRVTQVEYWSTTGATWVADTDNWNTKWTDWTIDLGMCWANSTKNWNNITETWAN